MKRAMVLLVDDEPDLLTLLQMTLSKMNIDTETATSLAEARASLKSSMPSLCLTDMKLPDGNGLDLIADIQRQYPGLPVAMMTAHGNVDTAIEALKLGAFDFVSKPVALDRLRNIVTQALKLSSLTSQATTQETLIGETPAIKALKEDIGRVARSQAPIHIHGESGVGKEVVARKIHNSGPRSNGPFLAINCGAIPSELVESELFGHRKGAFTGAATEKIGIFQAASGGTLLLDEIGDLPLPVQVKLLRAVQEKTVRPVGSESEISFDVRLISATHKNLSSEVSAGRFRDDLFYRINVIGLFVPPLRDRPDDIPLIAKHLVARIGGASGIKGLTISSEALKKLKEYDFPGNIRELENILARASALLDGTCIEASDIEIGSVTILAEHAGLADPVSQADPDKKTSDGRLPENLDSHLASIERNILEEALQAHRWNRTSAAKSLGITLRSLRYRLKKLGIED